MAIFKIYYLLPIFLISGPFLSDLLVSLTSLFFLFYFYRYEKKYIINKYTLYFFLAYCFLIFVSLFSVDKLISLKSTIPYFRFFLFSLIIWYCLEKKILNLKIFYFLLAIIISIFFFDSLLQFIYGFNILGQVSPLNYRITSFFGDEAKMGSYIFKIYILFSFINLLIKINYQKIIFSIITALAIVLVIMSGDRTPFFLMFIYFVILSFVFINKNNFINLFIFFILSFFLIFTNEVLKNRIILMTISGFFTTLENFNQDKINKKVEIQDQNLNKLKFYISDDHHSHFLSSKKIFLDNLLVGTGPNTFRIVCNKEDYYIKKNSCSTHPHNYYLQLSSETGIVGLSILIVIFLYSIYQIIKKIFVKKKNNSFVFIYIYIFIILFPLSPNGNFFNNWLSIINYLPFGFFIYYYNNRNYLFSKK